MLKYKYPHVANEESLSLGTIGLKRTNPLYYHIQFVKPGRATYVIQHKPAKKRKSELIFDSGNEESKVDIEPPNSYIH